MNMTIEERLLSPTKTKLPYDLGDWELTPESEALFDRNRSPLTPQESDAVTFGDTLCPWCLDKGRWKYQEREIHTGEIRDRHEPCRCRLWRHKAKALAQLLPIKYLRCNLKTLEPSEFSNMPLEKQRKMIDLFREQPNDSVFLWGKPGTGKTTFACALLRQAVNRDGKHWWKPLLGPIWYVKERWIWRVSFDTLMAQYLRSQNDPKAPEPDVTPEKIRKATEAGKKYVLCLEEVDKAKLTEHRCNKLFDIIDTLYNCEGQLIITTNKTRQGFEDMFTQTDNETINTTGEALIRRINEMCTPYEF